MPRYPVYSAVYGVSPNRNLLHYICIVGAVFTPFDRNSNEKSSLKAGFLRLHGKFLVLGTFLLILSASVEALTTGLRYKVWF